VNDKATSEPRADAYDVVVIGSGGGGITAAAMLARSGRKVLLAERQDGLGGYAHGFQRGPYTFDPAVHWTAQGAKGQLWRSVFDYLGVDDQIEFLPVDHAPSVRLPDQTQIDLPLGVEPFIEAHVQHFPGHREEIEAFYNLSYQMHREIHQLSMSVNLRNLDAAVEQFPTLFAHRSLTLGEVLDRHITDPKLRLVCAAQWPYHGLGPEQLAFFPYAQVVMNQLEGNWYPRGGFQSVVDGIAAAVELHGGETVMGNGVQRILVESGSVVGVRLDSGAEVRTPLVVSNADARQTFVELVGEEHVPTPFLRRLLRMEPSLSAFVLFLATTLDVTQFTHIHEIFMNRRWDQDESYRDVLDGRPGGMWITAPTVADPSLAPEGEHLVIVSAIALYDVDPPWNDRREQFAEELLDEANKVYPGLRDSITFSENGTPETLKAFSGNEGGAAYGWANNPQQAVKRLPLETPVGGLFLTGHWSRPGSSYFRCFTSGVQVSQMILMAAGERGWIPAFAEADLPAIG
jgi:phytoene desaturase